VLDVDIAVDAREDMNVPVTVAATANLGLRSAGWEVGLAPAVVQRDQTLRTSGAHRDVDVP
jgi:hypothetical protein